jgi:hypothetical protein
MSSPDKLTAWAVASQLALEVAKTTLSSAIKEWFARRDTSIPAVDEQELFAEYLYKRYSFLSTAKTIFLTQTPLPLGAFYEPLDVEYLAEEEMVLPSEWSKGSKVVRKLVSKTISSAGFQDLKGFTSFLLVSATAGAGKTTFLKNLFLEAAASGEVLPVFIELRRITSGALTFMEAIRAEFSAFNDTLPKDFAASLMRRGGLMIVLDGFDEVEQTQRAPLLNEMLNAYERYPENLFILSSRPDPKLESINILQVFRPMPLRLEQSIALIRRLPAETEDKDRFVAYLTSNPHPQFQSFVTNPLLLCIMFLTFIDAGSIQYSRTAFYQDAFQAMYNRHDASKYGYTRQFLSKLDRINLERVCEHLAIATFLKEKRSFTEGELFEILGSIAEALGLEFDAGAVTQDLLQTLCLLVRDGTVLTYTHRSFEEYFAARYIHSWDITERINFIKHITKRSIRDSVCIQVLHELEPHVIEKQILLPAVRRVLGNARTAVEATAHILYWMRSEQLGHGGWVTPKLTERLGKYGNYFRYLLGELDMLFPDQPKAPRKDRYDEVDLDNINNILHRKDGSLRTIMEIESSLRRLKPKDLIAAEWVAGLTLEQITWLCGVREKMEARAKKEEAFVKFLKPSVHKALFPERK